MLFGCMLCNKKGVENQIFAKRHECFPKKLEKLVKEHENESEEKEWHQVMIEKQKIYWKFLQIKRPRYVQQKDDLTLNNCFTAKPSKT